jgi:non-heme chloroperoxidase
MRISSVLKTIGISTVVAAAAAFTAERLLLRRINATAAPPGWRTPCWPVGNEIMVPTDDGAELLVEITGPEDAPTIVLIHGLSGDHHAWGLVAEALLRRGFRVVGMNQRGHGGSTVGTEGFGPERQGADVGQVLSALDLNGVTLVGHSMGGVAAMSLLTLRPETGADRVGALALAATLAQTVRADRDRSLRIGDSDFYRNLAVHPVHGPTLARWIFGGIPSREMLEDVMETGANCPQETSLGAARGLLGYDIRDKLGAISVPTTVICGTRDLLTRHIENEEIAAAIDGAEFVSVPGAGHMVIWENPEIITDVTAALAGAVPSPSIV